MPGLLFLIGLLLGLGLVCPLKALAQDQNQAKPKTICTITINSSDEREVFTKHLAPKGFRFHELVTDPKESEVGAGGEAEGETGKDNLSWFAKACKEAQAANLKCDALVISGHFGGTFFGSSGKILSLEELEEQSCSKGCEGILKNPSAVYLFGCNTLAGKEKDHRTPEQYLRVLLEDGIPRSTAESVVESRYGSTGSTNRDRMIRVFENSPRVYGFDSVGPSGQNVRSFLEDYFKKNPNYSKHLDSLATEKDSKNLTSLLKSFSRLNNKRDDPFQCSLKNTSVTCAHGICQSERIINDLLCSIRDASKPLSERLSLLSPLLKGDDALAYVPLAVAVFKDVGVSSLKGKDLLVYLEIQNNPKLKKQLRELIQKDTSLLDQKFSWIGFSRKMDWFSPDEKTAAVNSIASKLIDSFHEVESRDLFFSHIEEFSGMDVSNQRKLSGLLKDSNNDLKRAAAWALSETKPNDPKTHEALAAALLDSNSSSSVKRASARALRKIKPTDPKIHEALVAALQDYNSGVRGAAASALHEIKSNDPKIHEALAAALRDSSSGVKRAAAEALGKIKPTDPKIHEALVAALQDSNALVQIAAERALREIKPTDEDIKAKMRSARITVDW